MKARLLTQQKFQRGATLIVALIFLVVMTIAGVTATRFATFEERMASNSQFHNQAFQLAQSEIRAQLLAFNTSSVNKNVLIAAMTEANVPAVPSQTDLEADPSLATLPSTARMTHPLPRIIFENNIIQEDRNTIRFVRQGGCDQGSSLTTFQCVHFEINTTAEMAGGSNSWQSQGLSVETTVPN